MEQVKILVNAEPVPLARVRFSGRHCYQPKRNREYREVVQQAARSAMGGREPLTGEVSCVVKFYRNGVVYFDDAQITRATIEKYQSAFPKVEVEIRSVEQC